MAIKRAQRFHYVEWEFQRWLISETRARCIALGGADGLAGRGAYLDLVFHCYNDGSLPADLPGLAALLSVSVEAFAPFWEVIKHKFTTHRKQKNRLVMAEVSIRRKAFEQQRTQNSTAGHASAIKRQAKSRKEGQDNSSEISDIGNDRSTLIKKSLNHIEQHNTTQPRTTQPNEETRGERSLTPDRDCAHGGGDDLAAVRQAIQAYVPADDKIAFEVAMACRKVDPDVPISAVPLIVRLSVADGYSVKSAGLFLTTVPKFMHSEAWPFLKSLYDSATSHSSRVAEANATLVSPKAPAVIKRTCRAWLGMQGVA